MAGVSPKKLFLLALGLIFAVLGLGKSATASGRSVADRGSRTNRPGSPNKVVDRSRSVFSGGPLYIYQ